MRRILAQLDEHGFAWRAGLEVEFHVLKLAEGIAAPDHIAMPGPPPKVLPLNHGYQYLTEHRYDAIEPMMETLRSNLQALGLPLRSLEVEFGPSQVEVTFGATRGMQPADLMLLFRSATKQMLRARRLSRKLHVPSAIAACRLLGLASASFDRGCVIGHNLFPHRGRAIAAGAPLARRTVTKCDAGGRVQHTDDQRLQALHAELDGAGSCRMGV